MTLEQLQAQRDSILQEMGGPQSLQFKDRSVTKRSQEDLEGALARVDLEISKLQSSQGKTFTISTNRGL